MFHVPEEKRITQGMLASDKSFGNNGYFVLESFRRGRTFVIVASNGMGWEHVSVHVEEGKRQQLPTWREMCFVKDIFWDSEDVVMQLHPRKSQYVNHDPFTLHLWRPVDVPIPTPPIILV
jgi:hypothetical protein